MFVEDRGDHSGDSEAGEAGVGGAPGVAATPALAELPLELIERRLAELTGQLNAGTCRLLEYVAEFDRREGWANTGCLSSADWIAWRCALSTRTAREYVRVARRLQELPQIHAAFAAGGLSYSKVRPLTRVASADSEADLLELARHATASQLEKLLRTFKRVTSDEARITGERAYLGYCWEDDGSLCIRARLAPEHGAAFLRALEASRDGLWEERFEQADAETWDAEGVNGSAEPHSLPQMGESNGSAEPSGHGTGRRRAHDPPPPITNAEAFAALIETARTRGPTTTSGGERYLVNVHVDAAVLTGDGEGHCELEDGPALAPETARKLSCDASLVRILESEGQLLSVGRKTRSISPALRRALIARDRKCRFPGCERRRFLDAHHIEHWAHGGETSLENVALFCGGHHDLLHEGAFTVTGDANGELSVRSRYGLTLEPSPPLGPASDYDLIDANAAAGLEITEKTNLCGTGERMNLAYCVDAVIAACRDG